jgi:uncharacterized coiled-coil protein SlyX
VETRREPSPTPSPDDDLIASLRREIVQLKVKVAELSNRNAELTQQINNERYERPPHY